MSGNEIATIDSNRSVAEIKTSINLIQEVLASCMKREVHYGTIPGTSKPTLFKAGSEKILSLFRIAVDIDVEDLSTRDCSRYRVKARGVLPTGEIVGCGIGEASTDEEKYRWRAMVCEEEFNATPEDHRRIKWSKGSFGKPAYSVKQIRTNPADLANTCLKMAKKRAQIDLTLTATAASDVFEQDLEEMPEEIRSGLTGEDARHQSTGGKPTSTAPQAKSNNSNNSNDTPPSAPSGDYKPATEAQVKIIHVKMKQQGVSSESFCSHYKIKEVKDLPFSEVNAALKAIESGIIAEVAKTSPSPVKEEKQQDLPGRCIECGGEIIGDFCVNPDCVGYRDPEEM